MLAVDEQVLNVVKIGNSGYPIIMMHGWGQSLESLRALGELLAGSCQVYLVDLPGFGRSPLQADDWDTIQYAERIVAYMDAVGIAKADLLGHSFGGRVSIRLASRYPDRVRSVILVNSHGLRSHVTGKKKMRATIMKFMSNSLKKIDQIFKTQLFQNWFVPRYASVDYKNAGPLRKILVKTVNEDASDDASKITNPTFLLWGELDTETPVELGQRLNQLIQGSKLVVMPGKDHFPFLRGGEHLCARHILNFLQSLPAQTSGDLETGGKSE
jgi:pimeloyl-ACP methyl ester carboxylesterase